MKKVFAVIAGIMLIAACSTTTEFPWKQGSYIDVVNSAGSKIIIVDFYTDW